MPRKTENSERKGGTEKVGVKDRSKVKEYGQRVAAKHKRPGGNSGVKGAKAEDHRKSGKGRSSSVRRIPQ